MLKKLLLLLAFVALCQCQLGGETPTGVTDDVLTIVKWSSSQLSTFTLSNGEHLITNIRDVSQKLVAGIIYRFTLDVTVSEPTGTMKYTCRLAVFDQSWTQTREFLPDEPPKCTRI